MSTFGTRLTASTLGNHCWVATPLGMHFQSASTPGLPSTAITTLLKSSQVGSVLDQLVAEDLATSHDGGILISWDQVHELTRSRAYASSIPLLQLPVATPLVPRLQSQGSLTDPHFAIGVLGWSHPDGSSAAIDTLVGSVVRADGRLGLLSAPVWRLLNAIGAFDGRPPEQRTSDLTRRHWGTIRALAIEAEAVLDVFLVRSVVVTPDKLDIKFRKTSVGGTTVVEINPGFDGAPDRWLEYFDKAQSVPAYYNIPTQAGAVHVALSNPVRSVLREIKQLPGRRVAGARAEAFLLNPVAALGEDATKVIDVDQFSAAKEQAGIEFERFRAFVTKDALGYPGEVGIDIDTPSGGTSRRHFTDDELKTFVAGLERRLQAGLQLLAWKEFEFELDGDSTANLENLKSALDERTRPPIIVQHSSIFDLSSYYERVVGLGESQPFVSAYIVKKSDEEGWFGSNLLAVLRFRPPGAAEDVTLPLTPESLPDVQQAIASAKEAGSKLLRLTGCSEALPVDEVEAAATAFEAALKAPSTMPREGQLDQGLPPKARPTLLIKGNINAVEHQESREERLTADDGQTELPASLLKHVTLRQHQVSGIGRLQHLFKQSPDHCRGVLLADDMGLGKTLQLLTFMAWAFERDHRLPPALIVAPVSLLENWHEEIARFFRPGSLSTLTAYGDTLAELRVPRANIDAALQKEGLVRFLKPKWRGEARLVLTTYETLRDLEFSFAQEPWSILVCDEAQKIKNPNALVTRAAKKLNVQFRVACTGTPVENSLTDLWCLFDMIQPGLLGALNEFGRNYGRVIEAGLDAATEQAEKLRRLIDPQVIRRTKADVAKDLPKKIEIPDCQVEMSNEQRALYVGALQLLNAAPTNEEASVHHLGLLQHLRLICADPRHYGMETFVPEEPARYRRKAPKMDWLLRTLHGVRTKEEKALLFAEHRDVQRLLQHYIRAEFSVSAQIVNGDTSVAAKAHRSRQRIINEFQRAPGFGVLILSPLAVGFGVNIQAANHVIHYLRHWNPAKEDQATDRAYRIGQTRDVHVYCPLTVARDFKTFDVKLDELLGRKRALATDMLQGAGALSFADFDLRDIVPDAEIKCRDEPITLDLIERSAPRFFEAMAAALWHRQGYRCHLTQQSDAGVDVVGVRGSDGVLIQCKTSSRPDAQLGWEAVRDVVGGTAIYADQFPTVRFRRIGLTNQRFNERAHERARVNDVLLIDQAGLVGLIQTYPINRFDVLAKLSEPRI